LSIRTLVSSLVPFVEAHLVQSFSLLLKAGKVHKEMSMKLYVGNLSFQTSSEDLQELFSQAGTVQSVNVIEDRETGRSRGFAFVSMADAQGATQAISQMDGQMVDGRALRVNQAEDRQQGGGGGGRGGFGGGGGGGRGGFGGGGGGGGFGGGGGGGRGGRSW
jgi:RNA recognition motif-containing protein